MNEEVNTSHFSKRESELTNKILKMTEDIRTKHPELEPFLCELPETIPNDNNPQVLLKELEKHYESLNKILQRYLREKHH